MAHQVDTQPDLLNSALGRVHFCLASFGSFFFCFCPFVLFFFLYSTWYNFIFGLGLNEPNERARQNACRRGGGTTLGALLFVLPVFRAYTCCC